MLHVVVVVVIQSTGTRVPVRVRWLELLPWPEKVDAEQMHVSLDAKLT